jgi:hypothetical protein
LQLKKQLPKLLLDPKEETADVDLENNTWPKQEVKSKFDEKP